MDRKEIIQKRMDIDCISKIEKEKTIVETLLPFLKGRIGLYVSTNSEVNVFESLKDLDVYLPKTISSTEMEFRKYDGNLIKGKFNILEPVGEIIEPTDLDVIVVPMVSFNKRTRVGYGKGYYDRYLSKTNALKIGVAFDMQEDHSIIKKDTDVDMDIVITETRRIVCE